MSQAPKQQQIFYNKNKRASMARVQYPDVIVISNKILTKFLPEDF